MTKNRAHHASKWRIRRNAVTLSVLVAAAFLPACSITPQKIAVDELVKGIKADRAAAERVAEPISGPLSLDEAIARALKYNLERRVRLLEEALALGQFEAGKYDVLPKLLAQAGYRSRDEELITRSKDSVTGLPSLANPSISADRSTRYSDLGLTWNLLDFGTSYFNSKQNADRVMIAVERRRKAMHLLMQDVRTAFWRTAAAQRLQEDVRTAIVIAEDALADARKAEAERVRAPIDSMRYQRQLLENLRLLETAQQDLNSARLELTLLVNAPLAVELRVLEPAGRLGRKILELPVERLEEVAARRNADVREQFYGAQIAGNETRKVITRLFPSLSFNYDVKYDSNSYLIHQRWNEAGMSLSYNLLNLVSGPAQLRFAEAGVALADQRRMATQMATLAQVHIGRLKYSNALVQLGRAEAISDIDARIAQIVSNRESAQAQSQLEVVANRTSAILGLMRRYQALADAHAAASRLQATLGLEPEFESVEDISLGKLVEAVRASDREWESIGVAAESAQSEPQSPVAGPVAIEPAAVSVAPRRYMLKLTTELFTPVPERPIQPAQQPATTKDNVSAAVLRLIAQ